MAPVDVLIVEGFKSLPHDKIEIHRSEAGGDLIAANDASVVAVVTDVDHDAARVPTFDLEDIEGVARFVLLRANEGPR